MRQAHLRIAIATLMAAMSAACGTGAPSLPPSPTPRAATSFDEYGVAFCSAWEHIFAAVGNPDTAEGSALSKALDEAVATHDVAKAEQVAAEMRRELASARQDVAVGGGWTPARPIMVELDRVVAGFEVMTAAKVAKAKDPNATDPQGAFEGSGALVAWTAMFQAYAALGDKRPADVRPCGDLPISP